MGPDTCPTRAFYGHYLRWALRHLTDTRRPARRHRGAHHPCRPDRQHALDGTQTVSLEDGSVLTGFAAVVLAQGHLDVEAGDEERRLAAFADRHGLNLPAAGLPLGDGFLRRAPGGDGGAARTGPQLRRLPRGVDHGPRRHVRPAGRAAGVRGRRAASPCCTPVPGAACAAPRAGREREKASRAVMSRVC
ncbi:FAD/NAD(P)-binding protein [Streptomyces sp. L7]